MDAKKHLTTTTQSRKSEIVTRDNICERCAGTGKEIDDISTGAAMRLLRKKSGRTLIQVAAEMDYSVSFISDLEFGKRHWTNTTIESYKKSLT